MKTIDIDIPLGCFIAITGVSGSGKSTLINETLFPILAKELNRSRIHPLGYKLIEGLHFLDKVVEIDQKPIGRTPRSNPATYTGVFTHIRDLFAKLPESKIRGYRPGRFSFNVKGGRCESCTGDGIIKIPFIYDLKKEIPNSVIFWVANGTTVYKDILNSFVKEKIDFIYEDLGIGIHTVYKPVSYTHLRAHET